MAFLRLGIGNAMGTLSGAPGRRLPDAAAAHARSWSWVSDTSGLNAPSGALNNEAFSNHWSVQYIGAIVHCQ